MEKIFPGFFEQLLGLVEPWYISKVEHKELEVHIHIDFKRGANFSTKENCVVSTIRLSGNGGI